MLPCHAPKRHQMLCQTTLEHSGTCQLFICEHVQCVMASGIALQLVEAVRVHGGEGVSGTVGVHTPDLPNSLAWLDPGGRLSFGEVDHTTHLRWFTLGMCSLTSWTAFVPSHIAGAICTVA